jgi:transcriptional regulator with XRE-family HTH domain
MTPIRILFGQRVRQLRKEAGDMRQDEFADRCGYARSYISRVETGRANPSLKAIEIIAEALQVKVKDLFDS